MFNKLKSFSLAEVLTVVAIIGVVATLSVPNLNRNIEEKKWVAALRKIYPELETAYAQIIGNYGKPMGWDLRNNADAGDVSWRAYAYLSYILSPSKECYKSSTGCFASYGTVENDDNYYKMMLKDNSFLAVKMLSMSDIRSKVENHETSSNNDDFCHGYMGHIFVDVNGLQGENQLGRDIFKFYICNDEGIVADGDRPSGPVASADNATAWVLKAGNRDYLKCAAQLNWSTKRSCK